MNEKLSDLIFVSCLSITILIGLFSLPNQIVEHFGWANFDDVRRFVLWINVILVLLPWTIAIVRSYLGCPPMSKVVAWLHFIAKYFLFVVLGLFLLNLILFSLEWTSKEFYTKAEKMINWTFYFAFVSFVVIINRDYNRQQQFYKQLGRRFRVEDI